MSGAGLGRVKCAYCHRSHRAGVECPVRNREEKGAAGAAMKRVKALLDAAPGGTWFSSHHGKLVRASHADLRAVLALAEQAGELRCELREARRIATRDHHRTCICVLCKPLPRTARMRVLKRGVKEKR